jgi:hypothetical protein
MKSSDPAEDSFGRQTYDYRRLQHRFRPVDAETHLPVNLGFCAFSPLR